MICKKTVCALLVLALVLGLTACGGQTSKTRPKTQNTVEDVLQAGMQAYDSQGNAAQPSDAPDQSDVQNQGEVSDQTPDKGDASSGDGFIDTGYMEHVKNLDEVFDITGLTGNMLFAEVFNMVAAPAEYVGETIRMKGTMYVFTDPDTDKVYNSCFMRDAMGCCSQGFEFELAEGKYPAEDTPITVEGVFDIYEEDESTYCILRNARIL